MRNGGGKPITFVAQPALAPVVAGVYAKPDDLSEQGTPWRQLLLDYNRSGQNPLELLSAYQLYQEPVYGRLADRVTPQNLYILSAGWGLIPALFLTPYYDITFSQVKPDQKYKQRRKTDHYNDFAMIPAGTTEQIVFFGSKSYVPLFCSLTQELRTEKVVLYNTDYPPEAPDCVLMEFKNAKRDTNWQYDCANDFLEGLLRL